MWFVFFSQLIEIFYFKKGSIVFRVFGAENQNEMNFKTTCCNMANKRCNNVITEYKFLNATILQYIDFKTYTLVYKSLYLNSVTFII